MPYIKPNRRDDLLANQWTVAEPGELNFLICKTVLSSEHPTATIRELIAHYIKNRGVSYDTYNAIIGAVVCAGAELIRRDKSNINIECIIAEIAETLYVGEIAPYEDKKIAENGDIF